MKISNLFIVLLLLLQVACGPKSAGIKTTGVNRVWSSVPSYIKKMKPHVAFHSYAMHARAGDIRKFLESNKNDIQPAYFNLGIKSVIERDDLEIIKIVFDNIDSNKHLAATASLGYIQSKKALDYLLSQGAVINGIPYDLAAEMKNKGKIDPIGFAASRSVFLQMGAESDVAMAKLLIEAGADPYKKTHGKSVIEQLEAQAESFAEHSILAPRARKMERIAAYLKTVAKLSGIEKIVASGNLNVLKTKLNNKNLVSINFRGDTLLHIAAKENHLDIVKYIIKRKPELMKVKNKSGKTTLDMVKVNKTASAKYISCNQNKYCKNVAAFESYIEQNCSEQKSINACLSASKKDIHGIFRPENISERIVKHEYNSSCKRFDFKKCSRFMNNNSDTSFAALAKSTLEYFSNNKGESIYKSSCGETGSLKKCKRVDIKYPGMIDSKRLNQSIAFLSQKCRLKEDGWIYKGSQCRSGLAHGNGEAVNSEKNLSYKGKFVKGQRVKGKVFYSGQPMFDGALSSGKPNGAGVCFYQSEPEKCEFYEGKRVDVLFKQRIANAKQQEQMDAKLAEMKKMQQQQNDRISQIQGQVNASGQRQQQGSTVGQQIGDYAMQKAGEKVMDKLFDKLF